MEKPPPVVQPQTPEAEKRYECPMCQYRAATPSLLSRHINKHHPEVKSKTPQHLLKALSGKTSVSEMLSATAQYIENATNFDERLPDDVIAYLKREDAKTQLILRVIAVEKIQRALELGDRIKELEVELKGKMDAAEFKNSARPERYLDLIERLVALQEKELLFLNEVVKLGEVNLNDLVDKLVDAFGSAHVGSKRIRSLQLTDIELPDDPGERETMRKIFYSMGVGRLARSHSERGTTTKPIEAEVEESSGTNPAKDSRNQEPGHP